MIDLSKNRQPAHSVLVVDDNPHSRESLCDAASLLGYSSAACGSGKEALDLLAQQPADVVVTDLQMPGMDGLALVREVRARHEKTQIVMVTAHGSVGTAVEAMRYGALDYLEKPVQIEALESAIARAIEATKRGDRATAIPPGGNSDSVVMIGNSPAMQTLRQRIALVAPTDETVLITGESGTGKELVARSIHQASRRNGQAMISLNCPVLSAHLMESELFGHERGAFTSADHARVGRFELADQGTILLDEITEIDLPLQAKLLRVLQEKRFEKVGSSSTIEADVRVLATSNRDLLTEVAANRFRQDLYYRLNVVPIELPPLRARTEDVPLLVHHFLAAAVARVGRESLTVADSAMDLLCQHAWPGNVRELDNIVTRAALLTIGNQVTADQLRPWLLENSSEEISLNASGHVSVVGMRLEEMERQLIEQTLEHYEGHREKTAAALGISVRTLSNKLRSYGLAPRARTFAHV
ncbi:sigma-54-dependent Fis family transcriptional regulator [Bremerella cremea]|uniref:Sigma-54-dependent Fis family transcriptional regulator n=1 Tax=Bremerella cremea TaxID=1031537 RepID=A0A368KN01_9BACT|nr:sigma-54 dependent transcriptional regulator [Bremerella cremea]RCS41385.1 sigma-54-dependent Fis family transcriptional regulator [Bremerella cremea]